MLVINDKKEISAGYAGYLCDESKVKGTADRLAFPEKEEEISALIKEAGTSRTNVTLSNARTGITAGAVPEGGLLLSLEKFKKISLKGSDSLTVQAGVTLDEISSFLKKEKPGYFYPVDPTETSSAIGGNIATNASGAQSYFYGPTRNWVKKISVILPEGDKLEIERGQTSARGNMFSFSGYKVLIPGIKKIRAKNSAGYFTGDNMDLIDLFIGSEGTLGIITEADISILPRPENLLLILAFFPTQDAALGFFHAAKKELKEVLAYEYFDASALELLKRDFSIPESSGAVFFEKIIRDFDAETSQIEKLLQAHGSSMESVWAGESEKEMEKIKKFRHHLPEMVNSLIAGYQQKYPGIHKVGTDIAVPEGRIEEMMNFYYKRCREEKIEHLLFGHIGESHLHLNMLPDTPEQFKKAKLLGHEFAKKGIELGGTFTGEHGVGKLKRDFMIYLYSEEELKGMFAIKKMLDPGLILNRGNIFPQGL